MKWSRETKSAVSAPPMASLKLWPSRLAIGMSFEAQSPTAAFKDLVLIWSKDYTLKELDNVGEKASEYE